MCRQHVKKRNMLLTGICLLLVSSFSVSVMPASSITDGHDRASSESRNNRKTPLKLDKSQPEYVTKAYAVGLLGVRVRWPDRQEWLDRNRPFKITLFGENKLIKNYLEKLFSHYLFSGKRVKLFFINDVDEIPDCHLVYAPEIGKRELGRLLNKIKGKPILFISDVDGHLERGGHIKLKVVWKYKGSRRVKQLAFDINETAAREVGLIFSSNLLDSAQNNIAPFKPYRKQAELMEELCRLITWPKGAGLDNPVSPFVITVIGGEKFGEEVEDLYKGKRIKNKPIKVKYADKVNEIGSPHVIYIDHSKQKQLIEIISYTRRKPILTLGATPGFSREGVHINFFFNLTTLKVEINNDMAKESKLIISDLLLSQARLTVNR